MSLVIVGSFGLVEVRNQTLPKIVDDHPEIGPPGDDASGRSAPCAIIPRHTLLHHSGGRDPMNPPPKVPNADRRSREYLTLAEIDRLIAAAQHLGRHDQRDATMILLAYRHGLRVSELVELRREQVDLRQGLLHVRRRKNGLPSTHPLRGPELRALNKLLREYPENAYVFVSERGAPMTAATFRKLLARAGDAAKLGMPIHPHMLRHSTGFKLANDGQDTRAIQLYLWHKIYRIQPITRSSRRTVSMPSGWIDGWMSLPGNRDLHAIR
ncbi:tyrosine-type recombinase/integrase [Rhodospirillum rubrum]